VVVAKTTADWKQQVIVPELGGGTFVVTKEDREGEVPGDVTCRFTLPGLKELAGQGLPEVVCSSNV